MRVESFRSRRLPRMWVWLTSTLIALLCLAVSAPGFLSSVRQGQMPDAQAALAAALHDVGGQAKDGPGSNVVEALGTTDRRLAFQGHAQVFTDDDHSVSTKDVSVAVGVCKDCLNVSVALQMVLVTPKANDINNTVKAVAVNVDCPGCETAAVSIVYVVVTPHPGQAAKSVRDGVSKINAQFETMENWSHASLATVASRVSTAIAKFASLALAAGVSGAAHGAAPHAGMQPSGAVLPGGVQLVPALPGSPLVDVDHSE